MAVKDPLNGPDARMSRARPAWAMAAVTMLAVLLIPCDLIGAVQTAPPQPILLGPSAYRVSAADIAQILALGPPASRPWVLVSFGPPFEPTMPWYINVFLPPNHVTSTVRRGRMMVVKTTTPAQEAYDHVREWALDRIAEYGQVPGYLSDVERVRDGRDLNRPFPIHGVISDADLAGLVTFIRTSPPDPSFHGALGGAGSHVEGNWPIGNLVRHDDGSVEISLLDDEPHEKQGQRVSLRQNGTRWVVVGARYWIAD
jgi:hypothetical protein